MNFLKLRDEKQNSYNTWGNKYFSQKKFNRIGIFLLINFILKE